MLLIDCGALLNTALWLGQTFIFRAVLCGRHSLGVRLSSGLDQDAVHKDERLHLHCVDSHSCSKFSELHVTDCFSPTAVPPQKVWYGYYTQREKARSICTGVHRYRYPIVFASYRVHACGPLASRCSRRCTMTGFSVVFCIRTFRTWTGVRGLLANKRARRASCVVIWREEFSNTSRLGGANACCIGWHRITGGRLQVVLTLTRQTVCYRGISYI